MTFLPIVDRELRVLARRPSTVWSRFYAALGVMVIWLLLMMGAGTTPPATLAQRLFMALGITALSLCLLAGVFLTADCLSEEKREGTLGLLFLTDLRGYDVVLGKLMATSVHALYGLMALFPILALPLLVGGVTVGEFWRVVLVLLVTLLFSLGLGMLSSALHRESRDAVGLTFLGLLVLGGLLPLCWWLVVLVTRTAPHSLDWLLRSSPAYAFRTAFDFCYRTRSGAHEFWVTMQLVGLVGLGSLALAALLLPRTWQDEDRRASVPAVSSTGAPRSDQSDQSARRKRSELLEEAPYCWLALRPRSGSRLGPAIVGSLLAVWLVCLLLVFKKSRAQQGAFILCLLLGYGLHQVLKYFAAVEATRQVSEDRRSGALELLLVTPLNERQVVAGHARAFRQRLVPLAVCVGSLNLLLAWTVVLQTGPLRMRGTEMAIFVEMFLGGLVVLVLDLKAIQLVGFRSALRARRQSRAVLTTLGPVLGVPWAALFVLVFLSMGSPGSPETAFVIIGFWFGVGVITDVAVLARAAEGLRHGLRVCLTEPARLGASGGPVAPPSFLAARTTAPP